MRENNSFKGAQNLHKMAMLIRHVYQPYERFNPDIQPLLQNYTKNILDSIDQMTGSRAIKIPDSIEPNEEVALRSIDVMKEYNDYLNTWSHTIKEKIKEVEETNADKKHAYEIIEYWRSRSSILSTLYQDLKKPAVTTIKERVQIYNKRNTANETTYQEFENWMKKLVQQNAEAKDNSKFLNTLERQFKILRNEDLAAIEQCLPSLFSGLRLVFIISRHYKSEERMSKLISTIANEI